MAINENPASGRKIFFLYPTFSHRNVVIPSLRKQEYEIYIIDRYKDAKTILRTCPDAICYINIDTGMEPTQWVNFINSFQHEEALSSIMLGVISDRATTIIKNTFLLNTQLPGGFIDSRFLTEDELAAHLQSVFDINGCKGRRAYVRADCKDDLSAVLKLRGSSLIMKLLDISTVALACLTTKEMGMQLQPGMMLRDAVIFFGERRLAINTAVQSVKLGERHATVVLLFQGMISVNKLLIHEYMAERLQKNLLAIAAAAPADSTDYSRPVPAPAETAGSEEAGAEGAVTA